MLAKRNISVVGREISVRPRQAHRWERLLATAAGLAVALVLLSVTSIWLRRLLQGSLSEPTAPTRFLWNAVEMGVLLFAGANLLALGKWLLTVGVRGEVPRWGIWGGR